LLSPEKILLSSSVEYSSNTTTGSSKSLVNAKGLYGGANFPDNFRQINCGSGQMISQAVLANPLTNRNKTKDFDSGTVAWSLFRFDADDIFVNSNSITRPVIFEFNCTGFADNSGTQLIGGFYAGGKVIIAKSQNGEVFAKVSNPDFFNIEDSNTTAFINVDTTLEAVITGDIVSVSLVGVNNESVAGKGLREFVRLTSSIVQHYSQVNNLTIDLDL